MCGVCWVCRQMRVCWLTSSNALKEKRNFQRLSLALSSGTVERLYRNSSAGPSGRLGFSALASRIWSSSSLVGER